MNPRQAGRLGTIFILALTLAGCSFKAGYNPAYLPNQPLGLNLPGKALVVTSAEEGARVFDQNPTSFTGGGTTLSLPLGEITRQVALIVFGAAFAEGADGAATAEAGAEYRVILTPRVTKLTYAYNQLKNFGFAITPQVDMELEVRVLGPTGRGEDLRVFRSGTVDGDTYVLSGQPAEKVNQLVHLTLFKLMTDAALSIR